MPRRLRIGHAQQYRVAGDSGAYTVSGINAVLRRNALIGAAQGSYAISGRSATLTPSNGIPWNGDDGTETAWYQKDTTVQLKPYVQFTAGQTRTVDLAGYLVNATSVSWKAGGTAQPAWLTISGLTLVADGTQTAGTVTNVVLTAHGTRNVDCLPFTITVSAASGTVPVWSSTPARMAPGSTIRNVRQLKNATDGNPLSHAAKLEMIGQPSWMHFISPTGSQWHMVVDPDTPAQVLTGCVLRATHLGGSTSDSNPFTVYVNETVQIPAVYFKPGFKYAYDQAIWQFNDRDGTPISGMSVNPRNDPQPLSQSKHTSGGYRNADGKVWFGFGDWTAPTAGLFHTNQYWSGVGQQSSFMTFGVDNPTTLSVQFGSRLSFGDSSTDDEIWVPADEGNHLYDVANDRLLFMPLDAFSTQWNTGSGSVLQPDVPVYVDANTWKCVGDKTATYTERRPLRVACSVTAVGGNPLWKRGRVVSSSYNSGADETTVVMDWWDTYFPFQNPTKTGSFGVQTARLTEGSFQMGGWQEIGFERYDETAGKWVTTIADFNFTTGKWSRHNFHIDTTTFTSTQARTTSAVSSKNLSLCPASMTGRGIELHMFVPGSTSYGWTGVGVFSFSDMTLRKHTALAGTNCDGGSTPANDGTRYLYFWDYVQSKIHKWDVQGLAQVWTSQQLSYGGKPITSTLATSDNAFNNAEANADSTWLIYNSDLGKLVLVSQRSEQFTDFFLIDGFTGTSADPALSIEYLGAVDQDWTPVRTNNPVTVPSGVGGIGQRLYTPAGASFDLVRCPAPTHMHCLVLDGSAPQAWETLVPTSHWFVGAKGPSETFLGSGIFTGPEITDAKTPVQTTSIQGPTFGSWAPEYGLDGLPTGKVFNQQGGDGSHFCNGIDVYRFDQITGLSLPTTYNGVTDSSQFSDWNRRTHSSTIPGGTGHQDDIFLNPANLNEFQIPAWHQWNINIALEGYGFIQDAIAPASLPATPENNNKPYPGQTDPLRWGLSSYGINSRSSGSAEDIARWALISWNDTGANAFKRQVLQRRTTIPYLRDTVAEYNPTTQRILCMHSPSGDDRSYFFEFDPTNTVAAAMKWGPSGTAGSFRQVSLDGGNRSLGMNLIGKRSSLWWMEGSTYITRRHDVSLPARDCFVRFDNSTGIATALRGVNGNATLDAAHTSGYTIYLALDRENRQAYWLISRAVVNTSSPTNSQPGRLYRSHFDSLMSFVEVPFTNGDTLSFVQFVSTGSYKSLFYYDGHLYYHRRIAGSLPDSSPGDPLGQIMRLAVV